MKKIISAFISTCILCCLCICASADEEITITNTEIKSKNIPANGTIIAALYDKNNTLTQVRTYKGSEEKKYAEDMAEQIKVSETIKVFVWDLEALTPLGRVYRNSLENLPNTSDNNTMTLTANGTEFTAELEDNETAAAFKAMLPITLDMNELNGNEKYFYLDSALPSSSYRPGTINAGDIMLYGNNCIVVFYETFPSSYSYTKIGHITDTTKLKDALGTENIEINFR